MSKNYLKRLWQFAQNEHRRLILSIFIAVVAVIFGILPYYCVAQIIINLLSDNYTITFYMNWCLIAFSGYILKTILYSLSLSLSHKSAFKIIQNIRLQVIEKLPKMSLGSIQNIPSGKFKQIVIDQVESIEPPIAHMLPEMTSNILGPIFIIIYLAILDWRMAIISILSIPIGLFFLNFVMKDYNQKYFKSVEKTQLMNSSIVEYINGIEVIKAFNQNEKSYTQYKYRILDTAQYYYDWMKSCQLPMSLSKNFAPTTMLFVLPIGLIFYNRGSLSISIFIMSIILSLGIAGPLLEALNFIDTSARVKTIIDEIDLILNSPEQLHKKEEVLLPNLDISMKNIAFGYSKNLEILHDISLDIPYGTTTAFVGPSGGGKSTIAKLIGGFWDIEKGNITIGGINIKNIPLTQVYDLFAYVSQDNFLFNTTIKENIRMGNLLATDAQIEQAARDSGCDFFIKNLENGYDTMVGSFGSHLSGGERQRISIARAMIKNAPIIILDEATAYIDSENEAIIQKAIGNLIKKKSVLIIAHRLSTIVEVNQIFVINNGTLVGRGTHNDLLKTNKLYRKLWESHIERKG